jgi:hypothetical protein
MKDFNYIQYVNENPLMKETSGYGNYTKPDTMLETEDGPLGPDEELMQEQGNPKVDEFVDKIRELTQKMARSLNDNDLEYLKTKLQKWADSGFQATSL